ncbi:MAG: molybdenum cofactor guanylyltransferase [Candidatus Abyssobacteria bacterium SURF_17]|jgi:molybdopterin-guanine dinucleotide biosynthesis protein A|uniref:Probable molybdenum cofactor guanylyltransferase n=1 Tax=Candidatus Abyssobacteria bacterium SURF_17 TaxID=2093361 RepID=A0A419ESN0_9BACT|nr:MAG: molybdenum cofactor guanylyltransferase [Candidatus Abyssubacteria bacterium SURF_17]
MESVVILAGGKSTRMGRNKALLDFGGETLIERVFRILQEAFEQVIISANDTRAYEFLGAHVVRDVFADAGSLAGIHAGLLHARGQHCFIVACDMPFVNVELVRYLHGFTTDFDVVIPQSRYSEPSRTGLEPLHSFYSRNCIPHIEEQLRSNNLRIIDFFDQVNVRRVTIDEVRACDPEELSYFNINTPEKYELAKKKLLRQRGK